MEGQGFNGLSGLVDLVVSGSGSQIKKMFCHCGRWGIEFKIVIALGRSWGANMVYDAISGPPGPTGEKCTPPTKNVMFCHRGTRGKNYHFRDCLLQLFLGKQSEEK